MSNQGEIELFNTLEVWFQILLLKITLSPLNGWWLSIFMCLVNFLSIGFSCFISMSYSFFSFSFFLFFFSFIFIVPIDMHFKFLKSLVSWFHNMFGTIISRPKNHINDLKAIFGSFTLDVKNRITGVTKHVNPIKDLCICCQNTHSHLIIETFWSCMFYWENVCFIFVVMD